MHAINCLYRLYKVDRIHGWTDYTTVRRHKEFASWHPKT